MHKNVEGKDVTVEMRTKAYGNRAKYSIPLAIISSDLGF